METKELDILKQKANNIRIATIDTIGYLGVGHIGGALSIVELLTILYYKYIDTSPLELKKKIGISLCYQKVMLDLLCIVSSLIKAFSRKNGFIP
jgi:hypothetical protein